MPSPGRLARQLRSFWRVPVEQEVDAELDFHLAMATRELVERGMAPDAARAEAMRRFGDLSSVNAACRRLGRERDRNRSRAEYLTELRQDAGFAARQLLRARSFSAIAIATLALGIGATAAVFSALDAVVLRPLPFRDPDQVVRIFGTRRGETQGASNAQLAAWRDQRQAFAQLGGGVLQSGFTLTEGDAPEVLGGGRVTAEYLRAFGVAPALGRLFATDEDRPGHQHVVVLSHRLWVRRFAADPSILARSIHLDGEAYMVVGVMPESFDVTREGDELWVPLALSTEQLTNNAGRYLSVVARLQPGVSLAQANAALIAAERVAVATSPDGGVVSPPVARPFAENLAGDYRARLLVLLGAVGFVLLIACVNVANLLLARGTVRARELAIRAALGAGRSRLVRQLLTESALLAIVGALLGLALSYALLRGLLAVSPRDVPRLEQARIDGRVLAFTLGLAALSSMLFGLLPAVRSAGARLQGTLRAGGRGASEGTERDAVRALLVAAEVALAMTLLTGAGLLIRSALLVQRVDPGFDARNVLASRMVLPAARYRDADAVVQLYRRIEQAVAAVPGVRAAGLASVVPLSSSSMQSSVEAEEHRVARGEQLQSNLRMASPTYFTAMGIPLKEGRVFSSLDDAVAPPVVIVNETLARKLWPGERAVGRRLNTLSFVQGQPRWWIVVGIVGDLHDAGLAQPVAPEYYIPVAQTPPPLWSAVQRSLVVVARTHANPDALIRPVRLAVAAVDPGLPLADVSTMTEALAASVATARFNTLLLSTLGVIALALASVGIYGVVAYFVSQRTQEIGIRLALGATPTHIWRLVVQRGLTPILFGAVVGTVLSLLTTSVLRNQLYGVTPTDPATLASVGVLLIAVSLLAMYVPARRAMRVPPAVALNTG